MALQILDIIYLLILNPVKTYVILSYIYKFVTHNIFFKVNKRM